MAGKVNGTSASAGRGGRARRVSTSLAEINVVPLVDVMLVLLIIFMVTAPMIQRGIEVNLPTAVRADRIAGDRPFVTIPASYATDRRLYLGDEELPVAAVQERLRQRMETATDKDVYLRSDGAARVQELMEVIDSLKAAGVERVAVLSEPPPRTRR